jgi:GMP synthase-like glutamine amidotransferase
MSCYETEQNPHLLRIEDNYKAAIAHDKPILGICLGSQILCKVTGGQVLVGKGKELGAFR